MTIKNHDLHDEYFDTLSGGHASLRLKKIAETTDQAIAAMLDVFKQNGIAFPGDDRCANIEVEVYRIVKEDCK